MYSSSSTRSCKNVHSKSPHDFNNHVKGTPKTKSLNRNPYRRDALGEQELMERHPHELAIHDEVEGLRLVVRLGCETERMVYKSSRGDSLYRGQG